VHCELLVGLPKSPIAIRARVSIDATGGFRSSNGSVEEVPRRMPACDDRAEVIDEASANGLVRARIVISDTTMIRGSKWNAPACRRLQFGFLPLLSGR
jgi:hypothetical protein